MIQATSSTSNIYAKSPDAPSSPLKKEEPVTVEHAEAAFVHAFCRDRSLLLGVEGYALTSLEVALATPPRTDVGAVPVAPVPAPPTAVAA